MNANDPEFIYLVLILPSLFSLTLIAEGLSKVLKSRSGWLSLFLGIFFLLTVVFAYFFLVRK